MSTRKIIRTANLEVLKTWLVGGQVTNMGNYCEGFHNFYAQHCHTYPKTKEETRDMIEYLIFEYADSPSGENEPFQYWGEEYKFKMPSQHNFKILVNRVWDHISTINEDYMND